MMKSKSDQEWWDSQLLRDRIAIEAMKVIYANSPQEKDAHAIKWIAEGAYIMADAMLAARRTIDNAE